MNPALVVIDMQHYFFNTEERKAALGKLISSINDLIIFAEKNNIPVYQVVTIHKADKSTWNLVMKKHNFSALIEGSKEAQILPEIKYNSRQILIKKTRQSTFIRTNFEKDLKKHGIDTLILTGVFTHGCVGRTAIDAYQRDYHVIVAKEASFSDKKEQEKVMFDVIKNEQEQKILNNIEIKKFIKENI